MGLDHFLLVGDGVVLVLDVELVVLVIHAFDDSEVGRTGWDSDHVAVDLISQSDCDQLLAEVVGQELNRLLYFVIRVDPDDVGRVLCDLQELGVIGVCSYTNSDHRDAEGPSII